MNFMKYRTLYFVISLLFLIPGIVSLVLFGLQPSIDFTGGAELEVSIVDGITSEQELIETVAETFEVTSIQSSGENQWLLKGAELEFEKKQKTITLLSEKYGSVEELQFSHVGPSISRELLQKTVTAVVIVAVIITFFVWRAFDELKYGVCAIIAMFHDSLLLLGSFSILGYLYGVEVDILFVTALLTTLSFSVHDTIVVYDRIRELRRKSRKVDSVDSLNTAVLETLGRSVNNSLTIIFMLLALSLLGGATIQWFAVALLIGAITGTYSSTFTAVPLLMVWDEMSKRSKGKSKK